MKPVWRWFGPDDPISLSQIRQAGALGIVTALHNRKPGEVWPAEEIASTKAMIEQSGLTWDVCESIWMSDEIKLKGSLAKAEIEAWIGTMRNLAEAGVRIICYNFMPLLDWTRTDLSYEVAGRGQALRFDIVDFIIFDVHILKRPNAELGYDEQSLVEAATRFGTMDGTAQAALESNIIAGLPGSATGFTRDHLRTGIARFSQLSHDDLRANLASFLEVVVPEAEALGVKLAIHPDDPPRPLFGLPRCVSTAGDLRFMVAAQTTLTNGLTLCTGSLGAHPDNDLPGIASEFSDRIHFAHLRNVRREVNGSFFESGLLEGSTDMLDVLTRLIKDRPLPASDLPFRPDHGHLLEFEAGQKSNPGYSYIGRLKSLAELQGAIAAMSAEHK
ncbi:mannonate dehydratase [Sulfitobacter sp. SK012]|uniref:mannonate dehydratase n=1 Tax=Sulfitobacter sp. SK012 TaxID=1389005 RepID=UPI000E0C1C9A|nr:mannonate dehydratase [Sulfitobacter sp. SK012]AXI48199.1 mannonate dehydratase [Sulfitobacter sp. SK012]